MFRTDSTKANKIGQRTEAEKLRRTLKIMKVHSLKQRRLRGDLIETCKILTGREHVDSQLFFSVSYRLSQRMWALVEAVFAKMFDNCSQDFFSAQESSPIGTRCHTKSLKLNHRRTDGQTDGQTYGRLTITIPR